MDAALRLSGRVPHVLYNRAVARQLRGDYAAAIADLDEAIDLAPARSQTYYASRALAHRRRKDYQNATSDYAIAQTLREIHTGPPEFDEGEGGEGEGEGEGEGGGGEGGAPGSGKKGGKKQEIKDPREALRELLLENMGRITELFKAWDEDGDGHVSKAEWRKAIKELGLKAKQAEVDALFDTMDKDGGGSIQHAELQAQPSPRHLCTSPRHLGTSAPCLGTSAPLHPASAPRLGTSAPRHPASAPRSPPISRGRSCSRRAAKLPTPSWPAR